MNGANREVEKTKHLDDRSDTPNRLADGGPIRMCAGCGGKASQNTLLRFAAEMKNDVEIVIWDRKRRATGRGAYLHPNRDCLERALKRHAIERSLKLKHPAPRTMTQASEDVARWLEGSVDDGENSRLRTG